MTTSKALVRRAYPRVRIIEEGMREGMQIERRSITTEEKIRLIDMLSSTGLRHIVVGSFVSPRWTPQMADVEDVIRGMTPVDGVEYTALVLNDRGAERRDTFVPPLSVDTKPRLSVHVCDVFVQRNTNRTQQQEIDAWPGAVARAVADGATTATVRLNAAFGSNWVGDIAHDAKIALLHRMIDLWESNGVRVDGVWLGDPMGWNTPAMVEDLLAEITGRWPSITSFHLHLHDQRGAAMVSGYAALRSLPPTADLTIDTSIGGMGGCPYCGNGQATGMIATEDFVDMLEELGIKTDIDRARLIEAVLYAEQIVGRRLWGKLARTGPRPRGPDLYAMDMPFVESFDEASHFRNGPSVYSGQLLPWKESITSWQRPTEAQRESGSRG